MRNSNGNLRTLIVYSTIAIVLSGCMETGAQVEAARIRTEYATHKEAADACAQQVFDKPEYRRVETKSIFTTSHPTFPLQMLNDTSYPTKEDIKVMYALYSDIQECRKILADGAIKMNPAYAAVAIESFAASDRVWIEFTRGKMTWGQFNEGRKAVYEDTQKRFQEANGRVASQLQTDHRAEMADRQRAAEAMAQWAAQQQAIAAANRPRTLNCNTIGSSTQCTSF